MRTWGSRGLLVLVCANFAACIWFAQYIVTGWLIYTYVVGSFALLCAGVVMAE